MSSVSMEMLRAADDWVRVIFRDGILTPSQAAAWKRLVHAREAAVALAYDRRQQKGADAMTDFAPFLEETQRIRSHAAEVYAIDAEETRNAECLALLYAMDGEEEAAVGELRTMTDAQLKSMLVGMETLGELIYGVQIERCPGESYGTRRAHWLNHVAGKR